MRLNPARFNRHLKNIGQQVAWRRSYACACVDLVSGAPDPKHALCGGKGRLWDAPIETVCGVAKQEVNPEQAALGVYDTGDMTMTVGSDSPMWAHAGRYDRIILLNSTDVFSQPFQRGAPTERLIFAVKEISRCFWLGPDKQTIVEGGIPVIGTDGRPTWPDGGEPPLGAKYSLTGQRFDEYFIIDHLPSDRNEHSGSALPKRVSLRKWDLFGRGVTS